MPPWGLFSTFGVLTWVFKLAISACFRVVVHPKLKDILGKRMRYPLCEVQPAEAENAPVSDKSSGGQIMLRGLGGTTVLTLSSIADATLDDVYQALAARGLISASILGDCFISQGCSAPIPRRHTLSSLGITAGVTLHLSFRALGGAKKADTLSSPITAKQLTTFDCVLIPVPTIDKSKYMVGHLSNILPRRSLRPRKFTIHSGDHLDDDNLDPESGEDGDEASSWPSKKMALSKKRKGGRSKVATSPRKLDQDPAAVHRRLKATLRQRAKRDRDRQRAEGKLPSRPAKAGKGYDLQWTQDEIYILDGFRCNHAIIPFAKTPSVTSDSPPYVSSTPSTETIFEEHDLLDTCAVLRAYGLVLYPLLKSFLCLQHKTFIMFGAFDDHIRTKHGHTVPLGGPVSNVQKLTEHMKMAFSCAINGLPKTLPTSIQLPRLKSPVPFLTPPQHFLLCPFCEMPIHHKFGTTVANQNLKNHLHKDLLTSPCAAKVKRVEYGPHIGKSIDFSFLPDIQTFWAQALIGASLDLAVLALPEGWDPKAVC